MSGQMKLYFSREEPATQDDMIKKLQGYPCNNRNPSLLQGTKDFFKSIIFPEKADVAQFAGYCLGRAQDKTFDALYVNCKNYDFNSFGISKAKNNKNYVCSNCSQFVIAFKPKSCGGKIQYVFDENNSRLVHGSQSSDGTIDMNCVGQYIAKPSELIYCTEFTSSIFGSKRCNGLERRKLDAYFIEKNILNKNKIFISNTNVINQVCSTITQQYLQEHNVSLQLIHPLLESIFVSTGGKFTYKIDTKPETDELERIIIVLPYASSYINNEKYACKLLGLDGSHSKNVAMVKEDEEFKEGEDNSNAASETTIHQQQNNGKVKSMPIKELKVTYDKTKLLALTTYSPYGNLTPLAFSITMSEDIEEFKQLINFCNNESNQMNLNRPEMTVVTDRAQAIATTLEEVLDKALHFKCAQHLERNLKDKKWKDHLPLFHKARLATTIGKYNRAMAEMQTACEPMYKYLDEIPGWQRYQLINR
jgi:hypothetical protein